NTSTSRRSRPSMRRVTTKGIGVNQLSKIAAFTLLFVGGFPSESMATKCKSGGPPHYEVSGQSVAHIDYFNTRTEMPGVDVASFKVIPIPPHIIGRCESGKSEFYASDKNGVYFRNQKILGASTEGFEPFPLYTYSRDKHHVYSNGKILEGADPA